MALFEDGNTPQENYLEALVGEGKKYKTVEDLAKAYTHADAAISERNRELAETREELNARVRVEELLRQAREPQTPVTPQPANPPGQANTSLTEDDLVARIRQELQAEREQEKLERNVDLVTRKLIEVYGSEEKANEAIRAKAAELEVPLDFLKDSAATSPKAFFAALGIADSNPRPTPGAPKSDVLVVPNTNVVKPGTYAYYNSLRKEKGDSWYFSRATQNEIMKHAREKGDAFYQT